jgi:hypothetical protein
METGVMKNGENADTVEALIEEAMGARAGVMKAGKKGNT